MTPSRGEPRYGQAIACTNLRRETGGKQMRERSSETASWCHPRKVCGERVRHLNGHQRRAVGSDTVEVSLGGFKCFQSISSQSQFTKLQLTKLDETRTRINARGTPLFPLTRDLQVDAHKNRHGTYRGIRA